WADESSHPTASQRAPCRAGRAGRCIGAVARARARPRAPLRGVRLLLPRLEPDPRLDPAPARAARLRPLPPRQPTSPSPPGPRALAAVPAERPLHRHRLRPPLGGLARAVVAGRRRAV